MQQSEETAAEAEAQGGGGFHVVGKARIIETSLPHGLAQILEACRIDGEEAGEDHRLGRAEAGQRSDRLGLVLDQRCRPPRIGHLLIEAVKKPISPGPNSSTISRLGRDTPTRSSW